MEFEPGLVNLILQEFAAQSDSLPLLEYALKEMWHKRQSRVIGHTLYEAVGKVEGAISQHADAVLERLPEADKRLACARSPGSCAWRVKRAKRIRDCDCR